MTPPELDNLKLTMKLYARLLQRHDNAIIDFEGNIEKRGDSVRMQKFVYGSILRVRIVKFMLCVDQEETFHRSTADPSDDCLIYDIADRINEQYPEHWEAFAARCIIENADTVRCMYGVKTQLSPKGEVTWR